MGFSSSADACLILKHFWRYSRSRVRDPSSDSDKDEKTEKLVKSAMNALSKGEATLESLARQEEMETKMEEKLTTIDYHMTLSDRLVRGISSFGGINGLNFLTC
jgi:hypothetical protein